MLKKLMIILGIVCLGIFVWHHFTASKMEVDLVDVQIRLDNNWRDLEEEYQDNHLFWVNAIFQVHNPNQRKIHVCVIQVPKELQQVSKDIWDYNYEYPHWFSSGDTLKETISFIFSEEDISKENAVSLIRQASFVAYSNDTYYDYKIFDQLKNHWKAPLIEYIFGYGKSRVKSE